jgi:hypothetical protein
MVQVATPTTPGRAAPQSIGEGASPRDVAAGPAVDPAAATEALGAHRHALTGRRPGATTAAAAVCQFLWQLLRRAAAFGWHLLQMCMAMCIGIAVLDVPFFGAARLLGAADPIRQLPELTALVVAFNMSLPMAAWMRYRMRHDRRCIAEMAGAMLVEALLVIAAAWLGLIARERVVPVQHALMLPAMLVPMLYRLDLYTGRAGHRAHAAAHPGGAHA